MVNGDYSNEGAQLDDSGASYIELDPWEFGGDLTFEMYFSTDVLTDTTDQTLLYLHQPLGMKQMVFSLLNQEVLNCSLMQRMIAMVRKYWQPTF